MIRETGETGARHPKEFDPRAILCLMEKERSKTEPHDNERAYEAQQLVYDAWEAATDDQEAELMARALELNPRNVDALLYMLDSANLAVEAEIEALRNIVASGEEQLGAKAFKDLAGHFWSALETRPYMRARQRLAECLREAGQFAEAIVQYEERLVLNPNDNQGVRYLLLPLCLTVGQLEPARELIKKYQESEFNVVFAWCHVLERILTGDRPAAKKALAIARKQNPHMQVYIKGHRDLPRQLPDSYSPGSKEEALCFADVLRAAWKKHPEALEWLATQKMK
jgi:tetratricopeptide (TPR) repeat protein